MTEPTVKSYARETALATSVIAVIALLLGLFVARVVFMPIVLALTLTTVFRPLVRRLEDVRVPAVVGAPLVVVTALVLLTVTVRLLAPSVSSFVSMVPTALTEARTRLSAQPEPMGSIGRAIPVLGASRTPNTSGRPTLDVGGIAVRLFGTATELISTGLQTALLLIFFLAGGDKWRTRRRSRTHEFARELVQVGDAAQSAVSRYLVMTALISFGQAVLVTLAAWALGLPSPLIWGVLTFIAEFLPYVGGFAMVALLLLVGLAASQGIGHALLGPAAYLLITTVQNNVVSPIVYGRGLELNPAAILVSVIIWLFLWGVVGAFLAVPILAIIKIVCDRGGGALEPIGELIAG